MNQLDLSFRRLVHPQTYEQLSPSHRLIYKLLRPEILLMKFSIIELSLRGNFLIALPNEILSFHKLQKLDLSENEGISLKGISTFTCLRELLVQHIGLQSCHELLCLPSQLQKLDISHNELQGIPSSLLIIPQLQYDHNPLLFDPLYCQDIDLHDKKLKYLPEELFEVTTIETLNLSENPNINLHGISTLQSIEDLQLLVCKLSYIHHDIFTLQHLQTLILEDNELEYIPSDIARLSSLEYFNVEKNKLQLIPKEICSLPKLKMLNISDNLLFTLPDEFDILFTRRIEMILTENLFQAFSPFLEQSCVDYIFHNLNNIDREWLSSYTNKEILQKMDIYLASPTTSSFMTRSIPWKSFHKPLDLFSRIPMVEEKEEEEECYTEDSDIHFQYHECEFEEVEVEYENDFTNDMFL